MPLKMHSQDIGLSLILPAGDFPTVHCLYHVHRRQPNGGPPEMFYIGIALLKDVFNLIDAYKSTVWRHEITKDEELLITLIATTPDYIEARNLHHDHYKKFQPRANQRGRMSNRGLSITCVEGPYIGRIWPSLTIASRETGIHQTTLSNHLNARPGYERIRKMRFLRTYEVNKQ